MPPGMVVKMRIARPSASTEDGSIRPGSSDTQSTGTETFFVGEVGGMLVRADHRIGRRRAARRIREHDLIDDLRQRRPGREADG